jgi:hypothetical protein
MKTRYAIVAAFCAMLTSTNAAAEGSCGTYEGNLVTLNGTRRVSERVVTYRSGTGNEDEVVTETYVRSREGTRRSLWKRVRRVTTATSDGSQTVEEIEEPNRAAPSEPPRVVRRSVTTVSRSGTGSSFVERQVYERHLNGRFVLVCEESERSSGN